MRKTHIAVIMSTIFLSVDIFSSDLLETGAQITNCRELGMNYLRTKFCQTNNILKQGVAFTKEAMLEEINGGSANANKEIDVIQAVKEYFQGFSWSVPKKILRGNKNHTITIRFTIVPDNKTETDLAMRNASYAPELLSNVSTSVDLSFLDLNHTDSGNQRLTLPEQTSSQWNPALNGQAIMVGTVVFCVALYLTWKYLKKFFPSRVVERSDVHETEALLNEDQDIESAPKKFDKVELDDELDDDTSAEDRDSPYAEEEKKIEIDLEKITLQGLVSLVETQFFTENGDHALGVSIEDVPMVHILTRTGNKITASTSSIFSLRSNGKKISFETPEIHVPDTDSVTVSEKQNMQDLGDYYDCLNSLYTYLKTYNMRNSKPEDVVIPKSSNRSRATMSQSGRSRVSYLEAVGEDVCAEFQAYNEDSLSALLKRFALSVDEKRLYDQYEERLQSHIYQHENSWIAELIYDKTEIDKIREGAKTILADKKLACHFCSILFPPPGNDQLKALNLLLKLNGVSVSFSHGDFYYSTGQKITTLFKFEAKLSEIRDSVKGVGQNFMVSMSSYNSFMRSKKK